MNKVVLPGRSKGVRTVSVRQSLNGVSDFESGYQIVREGFSRAGHSRVMLIYLVFLNSCLVSQFVGLIIFFGNGNAVV